ncbi:type IV pilin protein [Nodosilinea sp. E11]|uniref:type IV pilin protein n=1 Tax=Nodosilinea sp. E11 TaxID=3037479 RepID=UPI0029346903|nr:type IV pilin-like G/H family protein [Nodosilinea sp. E11]WOD40662.1 type IV pilin-like G/H family protein [Nodosilinea sp. E11]
MANHRSWLRPSLISAVPNSQGFTLIELLVVIVILGALSLIALPSFLNQVARAKQAGALKYIGMVNRAQQAFFVEHARFATSTNELGLAANPVPADYTYIVTSTTTGLASTSTRAIPTNPALRGYAGVVFTTLNSTGEAQLAAMICQGTADTAPTPTPETVGNEVQITNCQQM